MSTKKRLKDQAVTVHIIQIWHNCFTCVAVQRHQKKGGYLKYSSVKRNIILYGVDNQKTLFENLFDLYNWDPNVLLLCTDIV